jgi:hypothetical protein
LEVAIAGLKEMHKRGIKVSGAYGIALHIVSLPIDK